MYDSPKTKNYITYFIDRNIIVIVRKMNMKL